MNMKQVLLINAIIWAAIMLFSAWLFKDDANYTYLFGALILGAGLTHTLIDQQRRKAKSRNCLK